MCGIAGIIDFSGQSLKKEVLTKMTHQMIYRGPDDEGFFINDNVGLGMRRLSIIDVRGGHQPIDNEDSSIWVVLNGEIYNYVELREELRKRGHKFRSESDTEVLVHGYEEKGFDFVKDLNGMFVFALYDKNRGGVWIVRDRLGIKPLYYSATQQRFLFSSDLTSFPREIGKEVDSEAVLAYIGLGYVPTPDTIYRDIKKLSPGQWMWISGGKVEIKSYWSVKRFETQNISTEDAKQQLDNLLRDAIGLQLRSDVPLGLMLSGGVDSSAVVAIAAASVKQPINTFTINFSNKAGEDSSYARQVARLYKTNHQEINLQTADLLTGLDEMIKVIDEPIADSAIMSTYLIAKFAREKGIKVMLSGAGGDEIFGGYSRHFLPRFGSPSWWSEHLPSPLRYIAGSVWAMFQPHRGFRVWNSGIAYLAGVFGTDLGFYQRTLKEKVFFQKLIQILCKTAAPVQQSEHNLGYSYSRMFFDLNSYLVDNILALTDKGTMGASVEGRVPLLDHRLVEFAFSLPHKTNLLNVQPKGLFRQVLNSYLPQEILNRNKEGFNAPIKIWMAAGLFDVIQKELQNYLASPLAEILNKKVVEKYLQVVPSQPFLASTLFSLYVFNKWWRCHFS